VNDLARRNLEVERRDVQPEIRRRLRVGCPLDRSSGQTGGCA
jgi:hypothetical protein